MKKHGILNSSITEVIAKMGHGDMIAIGDCGLPIPDCTKRIDIALIKNVPSFIETLKAVMEDFQTEEVLVAKETLEVSPMVYREIKELAGSAKITIISHEDLKKSLNTCKAVVRTGEQTPYANIILKSGVVF